MNSYRLSLYNLLEERAHGQREQACDGAEKCRDPLVDIVSLNENPHGMVMLHSPNPWLRQQLKSTPLTLTRPIDGMEVMQTMLLLVTHPFDLTQTCLQRDRHQEDLDRSEDRHQRVQGDA